MVPDWAAKNKQVFFYKILLLRYLGDSGSPKKSMLAVLVSITGVNAINRAHIPFNAFLSPFLSFFIKHHSFRSEKLHHL